MTINKIQLALAMATAAFASVPIGAGAAAVGERNAGYRKPGARYNRLPARAGERTIKKRVNPRGIDTSPGPRELKIKARLPAKKSGKGSWTE